MKTICMMMLVLGMIVVAGVGCKVKGEVGDTATTVAPAR
ncbi:MAG: hypothetical protein QOF78_1789 [Phycisphaerales bacterium]|jgi:hypothetical protein|nr:hypothetical protein [Phycisphaerales bacterium]